MNDEPKDDLVDEWRMFNVRLPGDMRKLVHAAFYAGAASLLAIIMVSLEPGEDPEATINRLVDELERRGGNEADTDGADAL